MISSHDDKPLLLGASGLGDEEIKVKGMVNLFSEAAMNDSEWA